MTTRNLMMASAIAATLTLAPLSQADTLEISVSKQSPELQSVSRPHTGMTKLSVEQIFGSPQALGGPIGEPPISNWSYPQFTVYFESDTVLHSVLRTTSKADTPE
jgi:hypothetical protein